MPRGRVGNDGLAIDKRELLAILNKLRNAVSPRPPQEILSGVLLEAGRATASNGEITVSVPLQWTGAAVVVPFARIHSIVSSATADTVSFQPSGNCLRVTAGNASWTIATSDAGEWPRLQDISHSPVCTLPASYLAASLKKVAYATESDGGRYVLSGVCLDWKDGEGHLVATDGRRMTVVSFSSDQATDAALMLLPPTAVKALQTLCAGRDDVSVDIAWSVSEAQFSVGDDVVRALLLNGSFPRWRDVIPSRDGITPSLVGAADLAAAARSAAICTSETSDSLSMEIGSEVVVSASSSEVGESRVVCSVIREGTHGKVRLRPRYLVQFCASLDSACAIEVEIGAESEPVVMRCEEEGVIAVVAPTEGSDT